MKMEKNDGDERRINPGKEMLKISYCQSFLERRTTVMNSITNLRATLREDGKVVGHVENKHDNKNKRSQNNNFI